MENGYCRTLSAQECGELASGLFQSGFNCAESVFLAVARAGGRDVTELAGLVTPFGGGMGRSHSEACGIISGGIMGVGLFHGRVRAGADWDAAAELAAAFRARFAEACAGTSCAQVLAAFGEQNELHKCKAMAGTMSAVLAGMLEEGVPSRADASSR